MSDVAAAAGVGLGTVSRAINNPASVAPETLAVVRKAIERLQYTPNLMAGSLASNRSRIVGCVVPTISSSIFAESVEGLSKGLAAEGYQLLLGQSQYLPAEELALVDAFLGRRVDGLVVIGTTHAEGLRERLRATPVPLVETWELTAEPIDMVVGFSNEQAGAEAARYLWGKGYRELAYIGSEEGRSRARYRGFCRSLEQSGGAVPAVRWIPTPSSMARAAEQMRELLAGPRRPRAVFCASDMLAAGVLFECSRAGLAVPADVAVMGFADLPIAEVSDPPLSTVQVRSRDIGARAATMLLSRLRGETGGPRSVDLGFAIVERGST